MIDFKLAKTMNINALFGEKGVCDCGSEHYLPPVEVYAFGGASENLSEVIEKLCPIGKIGVVYDENVGIYAEELKEKLSERPIEDIKLPLSCPVSEEVFGKIEVPEDARIIISVGAGTASDYGKLIAKRLEVPLVMFLTALSFDTIFESDVEIWRRFVLTKEKGAFPSAVFIDNDVIAEAPSEFFASGIALAATEYMTVFDCYTRERFLNVKICPHMADMLIYGVEKVLDSAEELKKGNKLALERFIDGMLKISAARAFLAVDLTDSSAATIRALWLLYKNEGKAPEALYGEKKFEIFTKLVNVISLLYETKTVEETLPPDMDYRYDLLTGDLAIDEWAAYKITSQIVSPSAYLALKKKMEENRAYFADAAKEMRKMLPKEAGAFELFEEDYESEEKDRLYKAMVCSTEVCGSFTTLTVMKYLGLLEKYDKK